MSTTIRMIAPFFVLPKYTWGMDLPSWDWPCVCRMSSGGGFLGGGGNWKADFSLIWQTLCFLINIINQIKMQFCTYTKTPPKWAIIIDDYSCPSTFLTSGHPVTHWEPACNKKLEERPTCLQLELRHPFLSSDIGAFTLGAGLTPPRSPTHTHSQAFRLGWITPQAFLVLQLGDGRLWNFLASINSMSQFL